MNAAINNGVVMDTVTKVAMVGKTVLSSPLKHDIYEKFYHGKLYEKEGWPSSKYLRGSPPKF